MKIFGIIVLIIIILAIIVFSLKDPDTGKSYWHNFVLAYGRFKNIYHELEEKRRYPEAAKKAPDKAEATTAASASAKPEEKSSTDATSSASEKEEKPVEAATTASPTEKAPADDAASGASKKEAAAPQAKTTITKQAPQHITLGQKAHDFIDAASAASFKTIDHKKLFAKLTGKDKKEK